MTEPEKVGGVPRGLKNAALAMACVLVIGAGAGLVLWLLVFLAPVTLALVAMLLMAALISPVTRWLRRLRFPAWAAALGGVLTLLAAVILPLILIGNQTFRQWPELQKGLTGGVDRIRELLLNGPLPLNEERLDRLTDSMTRAAQAAAPDLSASATAATQTLTAILLALVLLFFVLKDGPSMWRWVLRMLPVRAREPADRAAHAGWSTLVAYVHGTVFVAAVDAIGIGVALLVIGVPLALPLALLTFIAAFIPIVGATVAGAAAVLIALVSNGVTDALIVLAAVIAVQQAEGNLLQPLIMGRALKLHPAVILVAVTAGTLLAGIAGAVVAVPVVAVAYRVVTTLRTPVPLADEAPPEGPPGPVPDAPSGGPVGDDPEDTPGATIADVPASGRPSP